MSELQVERKKGGNAGTVNNDLRYKIVVLNEKLARANDLIDKISKGNHSALCNVSVGISMKCDCYLRRIQDYKNQ